MVLIYRDVFLLTLSSPCSVSRVAHIPFVPKAINVHQWVTKSNTFFPKLTDVIDTRCLCKKRWQEVFTLSVVSHCSFHLECGILSYWRPVSDSRFHIFVYISERWTESVPVVWKAGWYSITSADTGTVCMIQVYLSGKALSNHAKLFPFSFPHKIPILINPLIPQDQQR